MKKVIFPLLSFLAMVSFTPAAFAAEQNVGKVVALRGQAVIERRGFAMPAAVKSPIELNDAFRTDPASRAKLLFIDDSVLTLGENTRMSIKEFVYQKGKGGSSIFNMIDGKMRTVVGKTRFEVHTPTAVAAARGTVIYFEVGRLDNQDYTRILCLEGTVDVRSASPSVQGEVTLTAGKMVIVTANRPLPEPVDVPQAMLDYSGTIDDLSSQLPSVILYPQLPPVNLSPQPPSVNAVPQPPPVDLQPQHQPSKVKIRIDTP